jgi:hypothetical protein
MTSALKSCTSTFAVNDFSGPCAPAASEPAAGSLLPLPTHDLTDVGQVIARLQTELGFERRKSARATRDAAQAAMESAQKRELAEMRKAADERYAAAQVEAWGKILTGGAAIGGVGLSVLGRVEWRNCLLEKSDTLVRDGVNRIADGVVGLAASGMRHEADAADEAAAAARYAAKSLEKIVEEAVDDDVAAKESIRKALDFLREYESTRSQSRSAALHKM